VYLKKTKQEKERRVHKIDRERDGEIRG